MALYIGGVAVDATAAEIDVLDGLDRGSIIYGNASSVTSILDNGTNGQYLTTDGDDISWGTAAGGVSGITSDGTDITITSGDLIMGTHGKGIDFSANTDDAGGMTAEILDDYEEGTWDAVVTDGTNPMTMHGSYDTGYYTKVGNLVTVTGYFITTSLGSPAASGNIIITGLPFAVANNNAAYSGGGAGHCDGLAITAGESVSYYGVKNATYIYLRVWDETGGISAMQASEWSDNGQIILGFSYRAA